MAKQSGLGDNLYINGVDISGDVNSLGRIGGGPAVEDVTGIDKSAFERIGSIRDGSIEWVSYFNKTGAHLALRSLPDADTVVVYCRGTALGSPAACCMAKRVGYDATRDDSGSLRFAVQAQSNAFGVEWGTQLTSGKRTDGAAANGASVDLATVSTAFGLQAYLSVFAFTGTSVTVKLQDSADGVTFADLAVPATFVAATGPGAQRIAVTGTVRRYPPGGQLGNVHRGYVLRRRGPKRSGGVVLMTVPTPDGQRVMPNLPATDYRTFQIASPKSTHFRPASCAEVRCPNREHGWRTVIDESTDLGQRQAHYVRLESGRRYEETRETGDPRTTFTFEAGQSCFAQHTVSLDRPPMFIVRDGDWRGNPRGTEPTIHAGPDSWLDEFAEHQLTVSKLLENRS